MKTATLLSVSLLSVIAVAAAVIAPDWPPIVAGKTLYAKTDLRGKKAPELVAETWLSGKAPALKGKVLVVDFWATWCGPCRELIPEMNAWAKKFEKDVVFVGLSAEPAETVKGFMQKTPMNYNIAVDTKRTTSNVLGVEGIPHVMIVSPDGIVRWQGFPGSPEDKLTEEVIQQIVNASKAGN